MSTPRPDDRIDGMMRRWAAQTLEDAAPLEARSFLDVSTFPLTRRKKHQYLLRAAAAALILLVVAVGMLARTQTEHRTPPQHSVSAFRCPMHEPALRAGPRRSSSTALFPRPVDQMIVCSYSNDTPEEPSAAEHGRTSRLPRSLSVAFAQHLNEAPTSLADPNLCLTHFPGSALIARDAAGHIMPTVTVSPGCDQIAFMTSTTKRYLDRDDPILQQVTRSLAHK